LYRHIRVFPEGQFVAELDGKIVGSCSNAIVSETGWQAHGSWGATMGGPFLRRHDRDGSTLYGLDITVHPDVRRIGIGRAFYAARYELVERMSLTRYGTGCRMPDYRSFSAQNASTDVRTYANKVVAGEVDDRTLTPLLRYGLKFIGVIENYMEDLESANAAALLERTR
jgi:GNAT superfamily N-acetyltransferase